MRRNRKAQIPSQMFTYILTVIIIALMLYLGVKWMGTLWEKQGQISTAQLKTDLENAFEEIEGDYDSMEQRTFNVPSQLERVCFLDERMRKDGSWVNSPLCNNPNSDKYSPIVCEIWESEGQNVAFEPQLENPIYIKNVRVDNPGYLCINITEGTFKVKLQGKGDSVKVFK